ncbi:glycosyl hydrolase [Pontiellaceae bacterium B12227]|nr:glycosyl hydrolase [Pontiellaceae bacterium B12227]
MITDNEFKNPGVAWRGKPFWSWNGKLEKDELLHQIDVMKAMGMGGFFMHSRTGLETEYLGDEWFELINVCADYAESIGMEAWLYDEDRWPSGLAGGIVSQHPEYRQKAILMEVDPEGEGEDVIAEFTCDLDGVVCRNIVDAQRGESQPTPPSLYSADGERDEGVASTLLRFSVVEQGKSGFYNGYTYIDTMNRDATEAFLESTHEKYAEKCGDRLGKSIKGIFTDEPHRGALMDGFSMYRDDGAFCAPYTPVLFDEFEKRFGYDLRPKLPELFLQVEGQRVSQVKWHYVELLQQLFLENFAVPCQQWCEERNLILTGHVLHEDNLTAQTAMSGSVMRYYEYMTAPGVDVLSEGNRNYWIVKQLSSAARQTGKTQMLSELYGCTGWQMPFAGHKAVGDWQALLGVNLRCHHLSWYTMRGEAKRDYPASIMHQSAWHEEYKHVEDYFSRFGLMMAQGKTVCDVLVINPVESLWAQVYQGWSSILALQDEHLKTLEEQYQQLFTWLLESQIDFDYGDEEMIARLGDVEVGTLKVGCARYKTVIIAGMDTIRSTTLELLGRFTEEGGKVVVSGEAPSHIDAVPAEIDMANFEKITFEKNAVIQAVPESIAKVDAPDIFGQIRSTDDGLIFAALNVNRDERRKNAMVRIKTDLDIEEWNCETGERLSVATEIIDGWKTFSTDFPVGGLKLYVAAKQLGGWKAPAPEQGLSSPCKIDGPFDYTLSEPNICVLDFAEYKIGDAEWQAATEVLKIDQRIRDAHGIMRRGGEMLQPWFVAQQPVQELCNVELRFGFEIKTMPEWIDLILEEPENLQVEINGQSLGLNSSERWIDIAFHRARIPADILREGANAIVLKTRYTENSNIEAVYLLGEFGVEQQGMRRSIVPMIGKVEIGDLCAQGFPFYSGAIIYHVPIPGNAGRLKLSAIGGACARVDGQVLGWDPFEADISDCSQTVDVEVVLTRRNTFGPLHDCAQGRMHNGPDHWLTEGDEFSIDSVLVPSGILQPIVCSG